MGRKEWVGAGGFVRTFRLFFDAYSAKAVLFAAQPLMTTVHTLVINIHLTQTGSLRRNTLQ